MRFPIAPCRLPLRHRSGATLLELVLFMAFFAVTSGLIMGVLISTNETRLRQRIISDTNQTGLQLIQTITRRVRRAERVVFPALQSSGAILALQMGDVSDTPAIYSVQSGALLSILYETKTQISPTTATVSNFSVRNTSPDADRQSVELSFTLTRAASAISFEYHRNFSAIVSLFPDDLTQGSSCGCSVPVCSENTLSWQVCEEDACRAAVITLDCNSQ